MEKQISKDLKMPARLHKNISCMQYTNKLAPRSAASWVAWRAVASLAARGRAFAWRQSIGGGGAATSDSGTNQVTASLMQVPCEHIAGTLASKSAGHVSEQALPHCPAPREHIAVHLAMSLDSAARKLRLERTTRRLSRAKRSFRRRFRQYPREWTVSFAR